MELEEILSIGEPKPGKLLFFLVSVTSFSRDTSSSRRNSLAARLVDDFSSLAVGCAPMPKAAEGSKGCKRKGDIHLLLKFQKNKKKKPFEPVSEQQSYKYISTRILNLGQCFKTKLFLWNTATFHSEKFAIKGWDFFFNRIELAFTIIVRIIKMYYFTKPVFCRPAHYPYLSSVISITYSMSWVISSCSKRRPPLPDSNIQPAIFQQNNFHFFNAC